MIETTISTINAKLSDVYYILFHDISPIQHNTLPFDVIFSQQFSPNFIDRFKFLIKEIRRKYTNVRVIHFGDIGKDRGALVSIGITKNVCSCEREKKK